MNYCRTIICSLAVLVTLITAPALLADQPLQAAGVYGDVTTYTITRKGKKIGSHELRFARDNNTLVVDVNSEIEVTVLKIPVFTFKYTAQETWRDGKLLSVTSRVRENDKTSDVGLSSNGDLSNTNTLTGPLQVTRLNYTSNHWNPDVVNASRVFNTLTGEASEVTVELIGEETVANDIVAKHYRYSGDIKADTWYDASGKWVKLSFAGKDGSLIEYTINQ